MMKQAIVPPVGSHIIIDLYDCRASCLDDIESIKNILIESAKISNTTILDVKFHKFNPQGVSGYVLISESHLSIHTWPEYNYASVDVYTCGNNALPTKATDYIIEKLECKKPAVIKLERGIYAEKFKSEHG